MHVSYFFRGLVIGLSIAAPVGPIGILCIQRTLTEGKARGLASGLGAALADGLYGAVAGFGLTFISGFLLNHQSLIRSAGGMFLVYLGLRTFLKPADPSKDSPLVNTSNSIDSESKMAIKGLQKDKGLLSAFISTFFPTITNPLTIIFFTGVFAGLGILDTYKNYALAAMLVVGVFLGSALWWIILTFGASVWQRRLNLQKLRWINRVSGMIMLGFGIIALISLLG